MRDKDDGRSRIPALIAVVHGGTLYTKGGQQPHCRGQEPDLLAESPIIVSLEITDLLKGAKALDRDHSLDTLYDSLHNTAA